MKKLLTIGMMLCLTASAADATGRFFGRTCGNGSGFATRFGVLEAIGLTDDQRLICFNTEVPTFASGIGTISGLDMDTRLVGIDFRPATGELFGLGDAGGVYRLDLDTAEASLVSRLNVALEGTAFDIDFNPTVDRLRVVSNTGQNLRVNVDTGATTEDGDLTSTGVSGAAYTNNDGSTDTATTLFDIDATLDQVVIQAPPNNGNLNPTGMLLADASPDVGFDIYSTVRGGRTTDNTAMAVWQSEGRARLFRVNLLTGRAIVRGTFSSRSQVVDLAIPLQQF